MSWIGTIGEVAKTARIIWVDIAILIKDHIRRMRVEKAIRNNTSAVDGLRKPPTNSSRNENPS